MLLNPIERALLTTIVGEAASALARVDLVSVSIAEGHPLGEADAVSQLSTATASLKRVVDDASRLMLLANASTTPASQEAKE